MSMITDYDAPSAAAPTGPAEPTVPITLTTSLSQYAIPSGPYMVPVSWRRTHLSTLVNKLVSSSSSDELGTSAVPFDFIIDSSLLRTSLGDYLETQGLTSESTLSIEYVRSTLPPTRLAAFEHDDWVSSVDCSHSGAQGVYMTASYDGSVRLWSKTSPDEAVGVFSTVNKAQVQGGRATGLSAASWTVGGEAVVTGGLDGRVQMWTVEEAEEGWRSQRKWMGEAHNAPISAIDTAQGPAGASVLSGGWDGVVAVWDDVASSSSSSAPVESESEEDDDEEDPSAKRRKTASGKSSKPTRSSSSKSGSLDPTMTLWHAAPSAHTVTGAKHVFTPNSRVSSLLFERTFSSPTSKDANRAWSAGFNGLLKGWDLASGGIVHTSLSLPSSTQESRPILSLTHLAPSTLVTGAMDRGVHIFDTRAEGANLGIAIPNAHRGPVDVLKAHPLDTHLFASGSGVEAVVKVWDTRSCKKALFSLGVGTEGKKNAEKGVLGLDWSIDGQEVVAGGKDKCITVYRGHGIGVADK